MTARRRPRAVRATGLAVVTGLVLAGCGTAAGGSGDGGEQAPVFKGCLVSDDGGFADRSYQQSAAEGLSAAEEHAGIRTGRADSRSRTDFEPTLAAMVQQGCDLTVSVGPLLAGATGKAAAAHPEKQFVVVDDDSVTAENVKPLLYSTAEAGFLAGYLAAGVSRTGTVATYGGRDIPAVTETMDGFAQGVEHYNQENRKDVEVLGWDRQSRRGTFLGSFQDTARARSETRGLVGKGADVVLPVAGEAARGAVDAASAADGEGDEVLVIWPDVDGYESLDSGRQHLLTSVLKGLSASVEDVLTRAAEGTFENAAYVGNLENGGVGLAPYHEQQKAVGERLDRQVRQLERDVVAGRVTVDAARVPAS